MNHFYKVTYSEDGFERLFEAEATNPGTAFALCLKAHPGATVIKAIARGSWAGSEGFTEHLPPPVQRLPVKEPRPARAMRKKERGCEFPFYDEVQVKQ